MAIFHLSIQALGRRAGRSSVAAAAYRSGMRLVDQRTGQTHDFTRRQGVLWSGVYTPAAAPTWALNRERLWSAAESAEVRCNARTAREIEVSLPVELAAAERLQLAQKLARELVKKHGVVVDLAVHAPGRGDARNFHAHLLLTTREMGGDGLGKKVREWDDRKSGPALISWWRERWAELVNSALHLAGKQQKVDHRSLADQGLNRSPENHLGPHASAFERRTRRSSRRRQVRDEHAADHAAAREVHAAVRRAHEAAKAELAEELQTINVSKPSLAGIVAANKSAAAKTVSKPSSNFSTRKGNDDDYSPY